MFVFLSDRKNFLGTQNWVQINHGIRAIGVRVIEGLLYIYFSVGKNHFGTSFMATGCIFVMEPDRLSCDYLVVCDIMT